MTIPNRYRAWMEVDLDAIVHNYHEAAKLLKPGQEIAAVVKADAYGLGAVQIAKALSDAGCAHFCVATFDEAMELREHGISARLMTLAPIPAEELSTAIQNRMEFPITGFRQAELFSKLAAGQSVHPTVHIKIDVGLSRIGIVAEHHPQSAIDEILRIFSLPNLHIAGLMSHITCSSSIGGDEFNRNQLRLYTQIADAVSRKGYIFERHCLSSSPFLQYLDDSYDFVRLGALLYGSLPGVKVPFPLRPSVGLYTRIIQIKRVPAGTPVSYGPEFHTLRNTVIATIGIGFSDGIRRSIVNGGKVLVRGKKASYIGKLCSDFAMIDITDVPDAKEGDIVTIFGTDGNLTQGVEDYAALYPASVSETTAVLTKRIPRFYQTISKHEKGACV